MKVKRCLILVYPLILVICWSGYIFYDIYEWMDVEGDKL